jgi:hypothetical protein
MESLPLPGMWVEIVRDINAIPAGVYRVTGVDEAMVHFRVGNSVAFCVSTDALGLMCAHPESRGIQLATTVKAFVERYYTLLEEERRKTHQSALPLTMCALSADLTPNGKRTKRICH